MKITNFFQTLVLVGLILNSTYSLATSANEIEKAQKEGKAMYIVVTGKMVSGTDDLINIVKKTQKKAKNTTLIILDRDDEVNSELVKKYRLASAPLPLVLVVASNGAISGNLTPDNITEEKLLTYLPTKTQAEVLLGFENGKVALIICGKKNSIDINTIKAESEIAMKNLGNRATVSFVDLESKDEANFINLINPDLNKTTVLIFNGKGQYIGSLESSAKSKDIVALVNKKISGGCCPGGSSSGGCGKK